MYVGRQGTAGTGEENAQHVWQLLLNGLQSQVPSTRRTAPYRAAAHGRLPAVESPLKDDDVV